ncbi:MAG: hypothetical protein N2Z84_00120 [Atribacterota bacterium]|nr:hypothetical protein [Atribacterota bacterium]
MSTVVFPFLFMDSLRILISQGLFVKAWQRPEMEDIGKGESVMNRTKIY